MHIAIDDFCVLISALKRSSAEKALVVLWYYNQQQPGISMTPGALAKVLSDHHVGTPHSTRMAAALRQSGLVTASKNGLALKPGSPRIIRDWLPSDLEGFQPPMDHANGYLPEAVWGGTRGYLESVCRQFNGCFRAAYYDAALVMLRRILETLIIEAYDHLGRLPEILDGSGNPHMFGALTDRASGTSNHPGLTIGRNTKRALDAVKKLGDRSAHDRRFNACAADLQAIRIDVRSAVQDLIQLGLLKRP